MILRDYQEEGLQALWDFFKTHKVGNPVLAWPTGTGKSILPAEFIRRTMVQFPNQRFMLSTHVKELIQQNFNELTGLWKGAPAGIYSAGLKRRDILPPVIYGGIQSMRKIAAAFGHRDILFIDEAHLVSQDDASMYLTFIAVLLSINPRMRVVGLSATPYRMGQGMIIDGGLFTHICHDLTSMENFNKLVADGYLAPLIPKKTQIELDVSNVGIQHGEFIASQLQHEVDKAEITWKAMQELCHYGQNRRSWLIYATGIEHANHISEMLYKLGVECASVHSKQSDEYNSSALKAHKSLKLKAIVSFSKLTTGLNHPCVDLIGMLRPTMSVPLWVQMLGRGTRPWELEGWLNCYGENIFLEGGKKNCLVLDFAKNATRLGPINDPVIPRKKGDKGGDVPIKLCEACGVYHHIKAIRCDNCGQPFEFKVKIFERSGTEELIRQPEALLIETFDVSYVIYNKKQKADRPPYLKITYFCGMNAFSEAVFPENKKARKIFADWWRVRHRLEVPDTCDQALSVTNELRMPKRVRVHVNRMVNGRNFPEILSCEFM
jgi:DNA repair protein RadD